MFPLITPPDGRRLFVTTVNSKIEILHTRTLPAGAKIWTWEGAPEWYYPEQWPWNKEAERAGDKADSSTRRERDKRRRETPLFRDQPVGEHDSG